jgi:hypothetical protein
MGWKLEDLEGLKPGDISWMILGGWEELNTADSPRRGRGRPAKEPSLADERIWQNRTVASGARAEVGGA